jgi:hypothetical protein
MCAYKNFQGVTVSRILAGRVASILAPISGALKLSCANIPPGTLRGGERNAVDGARWDRRAMGRKRPGKTFGAQNRLTSPSSCTCRADTRSSWSSRTFKGLRGVSTIPLADGRAFLALDQGGGLAHFEVAILDRLEAIPRQSGQYTSLSELRDTIRGWRRDSRLTFHSKSIIVVDNIGPVERRPLSPLRTRRTARGTDHQAETRRR